VGDEREWLERTFICLMCKFQLVWLMHMRITVLLVKLVFRRIEGFKMEQIVAIKFFVELKKRATETFEMLKNAYGEECSSRISVFELHERLKEGSES
jgi:hypothetical protein